MANNEKHVESSSKRGISVGVLLGGILIAFVLGAGSIWSVLVLSGNTAQESLVATDGFNERVREALLDNPEMLIEATDLLQARQEQAAVQYDTALINEYEGPLFNGPDGYFGTGDAVAVEFFDYECGYCKRQAPVLKQFVAAGNPGKIILKEFPILGPGSEMASRAAIAVRITEGNDRYVEFHNALMAHQGRINEDVIETLLADAGHDVAMIKAQMDSVAVSREIEGNRNLAQQLRINGTPGMVFRNSIARGLLSVEELASRVNGG